MKAHPTDQQLINERFGLNSDRLSGKLAAHLAACPDCRARSEQLRQKLAALDALKENVTAPEKLIADTLREVRKLRHEPQAEPLLFPRLAWLTAAAAAALVIAVFIPALFRAEKPAVLAMGEKAKSPPPAAAPEPEIALDVDLSRESAPPADAEKETEMMLGESVTAPPAAPAAPRQEPFALALGRAAAAPEPEAKAFVPATPPSPQEDDKDERVAGLELALAPPREEAGQDQSAFRSSDAYEANLFAPAKPAAAAVPAPPPALGGEVAVYAFAARSEPRADKALAYGAFAKRSALMAAAPAEASAGSETRPTTLTRQAVGRLSEPAAEEPARHEWKVGPGGAVHVTTELAGFTTNPENALRATWSWNVFVQNTGSEPVTVQVRRYFPHEDWTVSASGEGITAAREKPTSALMTVLLQPYEERSFEYSVEAPVALTDPGEPVSVDIEEGETP